MLEVIDKGSVTEAHPVPLLFVHGGWHGAWCWDECFLDYFADRGFRAAAVSLRGHGKSTTSKPLNSCSVDDYAADVRAVANTLGGSPAVLGHSMGGYVVQKYLETNRSPAGVLIASAPPQGARKASIRMTLRHPLAVIRVNLFGETHAVVNTSRLARVHLFCKRTPQKTVDGCVGRLQPESALAMKQMMSSKRVQPELIATPLLVLGAVEDGFFTRAEVTATATSYRTDAEFFPNMGHNMMLEPGWQSVAERIEGWLTAQGL